MEAEDRELRSALQRLAPSAQEAPPLATILKGGRRLRLRRRAEKAGIAILVVALLVGAAAGIRWLTRELPTRTTDQAPVVTEPVPGTPETYEPLTELPSFAVDDMREIDVSGPGAAFVALTPDANPASVDEILAAYAAVTLIPPPEGGYTFPDGEPDLTMALIPKSGEPLYVGMQLVMSSVSLEVWTAGTSGVARRAWVSGDALHSHFRHYFALASQYSLTSLPVLRGDNIRTVMIHGGDAEGSWSPDTNLVEIDAIVAAYDRAIVLPPPPETYHLADRQPALSITVSLNQGLPIAIMLFAGTSSDDIEVWSFSDGSGMPSRALVEGDHLRDLLRSHASQPLVRSGTSSATTSTTPLAEVPSAAELERVAALLKEVGIEDVVVGTRVLGSDATPWRGYELAWTAGHEEALLVTQDRAERALAMAMSRGELSLDHYETVITLNGVTGGGTNGQILAYDPALWQVDPTTTLQESREALLPKVESLAADYRVTPVVAGIEVAQATQVLSVEVTMPRDGDTQNLTKFVDQLWGLVNVLNDLERGGPGQVGVGYLRVVDPEGATLVFEVNDFMTGSGMAKAEVKYPDGA